MAEKHFVVVIDGVRQAMSSSQFETHFGHKPTRPTGESHFSSGSNYTFGGRYEHSTWDSGSTGVNGLATGVNNLEAGIVLKNSGLMSGSL
tara:strand:- start:163 stop:432 length:270 start_codon:yes stop_codon:yes gene_type:complete